MEDYDTMYNRSFVNEEIRSTRYGGVDSARDGAGAPSSLPTNRQTRRIRFADARGEKSDVSALHTADGPNSQASSWQQTPRSSHGANIVERRPSLSILTNDGWDYDTMYNGSFVNEEIRSTRYGGVDSARDGVGAPSSLPTNRQTRRIRFADARGEKSDVSTLHTANGPNSQASSWQQTPQSSHGANIVERRPSLSILTNDGWMHELQSLLCSIPYEERNSALAAVSQSLFSDCTIFSYDPVSRETFVHGTDESVAPNASVDAALNGVAVDRMGSMLWRCQRYDSNNLYSLLRSGDFEHGDRRHSIYKWLIVPSRNKRIAFEVQKTLDQETLKVELQSKNDYAIGVLSQLTPGIRKDRKVWCCCEENVYYVDGSVPHCSGDDDSMIRCRRQLQWIVYHGTKACYPPFGSSRPMSPTRLLFLDGKTPTCKEIQEMDELLIYFPIWEALVANRSPDPRSVTGFNHEEPESSYDRIEVEELDSEGDSDYEGAVVNR